MNFLIFFPTPRVSFITDITHGQNVTDKTNPFFLTSNPRLPLTPFHLRSRSTSSLSLCVDHAVYVLGYSANSRPVTRTGTHKIPFIPIELECTRKISEKARLFGDYSRLLRGLSLNQFRPQVVGRGDCKRLTRYLVKQGQGAIITMHVWTVLITKCC